MKYFKLAVFLLLASLPLAALAQDTSFIPLTQNTPFLEGAGDASTLPVFLNNLYKICIGLAAVIAVLQIMRAGVMYMGGDSVTEKKEAKNLIGLAIGGLILVLSPVVVFGIINPDILSLKIDGIEDLRVADPAPQAPATCTPACTDGKVCTNGACAAPAAGGGGTGGSCSTVANGSQVGTSALQACCSAQAGCKVQVPTGSSAATPTCSCSAPATQTQTQTQASGIPAPFTYLHRFYDPPGGPRKTLGPVPRDVPNRESKGEQCANAGGETDEAIISTSNCSAEDMRLIASEYKAYAKCATMRVTCTKR